MIRRDDGNDWLLIPQIQHAHLAAEIAAVWGNNVVPRLPMSDLLVSAIRDHDVGWHDWAESPRIDPLTGRPRNFTEMPMPVATVIWSKSINSCGTSSRLAGIWVSQHFCWLAEQAGESRRDAEDLAAIELFLDGQAALQKNWRAQEAETNAWDDLDPIIETGFRFVQFFDRMSLWICCQPRTEPYEIQMPGGDPIQLTPLSENGIQVRPYPLSVDELKLSVVARRVPALKYADDQQFLTAMQAASEEQLVWCLLNLSSG